MIIIIMRHDENQYLELINTILEKGTAENTRNGMVKSYFGYSMRFSLKDGTLPLLTTKKLAWKTCFKELIWFLRGSTNNCELVEQNVHIWDGNGSREFLDSCGFFGREEGDLGPIYGHQWRHFNAPYADCHTDYSGQGVDQLASIIHMLRTPELRTSRRIILSAWNPCQLNEMALPPCHLLAQFNVRENRYLSCALYQRSGDVGLGVPFNIASYSFLTHMLAHHCGLEADEFVHFLGNCHIYESHIEPLQTQLTRAPYPFPKIAFANEHENIEDYCLDDIIWNTEYQCHGPIQMKMIA
jgi:thymidylate synthase